MGFSWVHLLLILLIVLVLFGPNKLPDFAKSLAKAVREFKKGLKEPDEDEPEKEKKTKRAVKKKKK
jgi:sec-independent protein translocase protein TatA